MAVIGTVFFRAYTCLLVETETVTEDPPELAKTVYVAEVEPEKLRLSLSALVTPTLYEPLVAEIGDVTCSEADALAPEAMLSADVFEDTDHPFGAKVCKLKLDVPQATSLLVTEIV